MRKAFAAALLPDFNAILVLRSSLAQPEGRHGLKSAPREGAHREE
jgi:hypothetical protein